MEFISNKYYNWYYSIIEKAQTRVIDKNTYYESHHIIPRSIGGSNQSSNLVKLLAREHFICHLLLTKFTTGSSKKKMDHAAFMLTVKGRGQERYQVNNRQYEVLRKRYAESKVGTKTGPHSEEWCQNISKALKGKPMKEEQKKKLSAIKKGVPWSAERRKACKKIMTPYGVFYSKSEAERELGLGANVISYRIKTQPDKYFEINE